MIKQYCEIRKTTTGQGDDYTKGCLLGYQYFKDRYNLIAVDLSKQKELNANLRAIQKIQLYGMLKTKSQVCTVLEKSKETMLEFYKRTAKVLWIIRTVEYSKINVKLSDTQLKKLKTAVKNKTETTLRMSLKSLSPLGITAASSSIKCINPKENTWIW